jgi:hypothetical protein
MFAVPLENISIDIPTSEFHFPTNDCLSLGIGSTPLQDENNVQISTQYKKTIAFKIIALEYLCDADKLPHARQDRVPAGKIFWRNSLRLAAKFDGLIITIPLLDFDEIIELHLTLPIRQSFRQTK